MVREVLNDLRGFPGLVEALYGIRDEDRAQVDNWKAEIGRLG
jgi:hypothetical protein